MENGEGNLESRFARLTVGDPSYGINGNDGLFQVMKAVEAAEATIKQQVEENNRLRTELQKKNEELETYKSGNMKYQNLELGGRWGDHVNRTSSTGDADINSGQGFSTSVVLQQDMIRGDKDHAIYSYTKNQLDSSKASRSLDVIHGGEVVPDDSGISEVMKPSTTLFSPASYPKDGNSDLELRITGSGLISTSQVNNSSSSNKDLVVKIQENEEEILQLKKYLAELSAKEAENLTEKYALEKRISHMRMAFDQQQQDLVLAASKAISYRQDIIEENVRLTYALQAAQQERSTFVSSLMAFLMEYSLQPPVPDAQSIVSNVKVLFRHLQEQLHMNERKLKESQYQLAPWRSDVNSSNLTQLPLYPSEVKNGLELVPKPTYSDGKMPSSDTHTTGDGDILDHPQSGLEDAKILDHNDFEGQPPLASRNTASRKVHSQPVFSQDQHVLRNNEGNVGKKVTFGDLVRSSEMDKASNTRSDREPSVTTATLDDPSSSYSPYLPPVLEEPSSSLSETADDDPLPAIEGLQISGEAFPGQLLQASGYSINGTTSCNFEWVRHLEDGSFNYVDGAKQPSYLVTADDVDTCLAIEVQPLDDRKRKGELVKVFANEHRKITCDPEMHNCIEKTLSAGHASYKLSLSTGYIDIWEPATLTIKRDGYSIKCSTPISGKFSPSTSVSIPYGSPTEFCIVDPQGIERMLRVDTDSLDVSCSRDTIVLTLRLFILKAGEKKKSKKRNLFFNM